MAALQEYKCPCCGGAIRWDSAAQKLKCPYCDTEFEMETLQSYDEQLNNEKEDDLTWDTNAGTSWLDGETDGMMTAQRHIGLARRASAALDAALAAIAAGMPLDAAAIDIREAMEALAEITGENAAEAVIDRVFSSFCVGK